jgi:hypothetical protein
MFAADLLLPWNFRTPSTHPEKTSLGTTAPWALKQNETKRLFVRLELFMAVTMENAVFWDIKAHFVPHWRHITSPLQSPTG